jgi:hypothetical protein
MAESTNRSYDLADMLNKTQQSASETTTIQNRYIGAQDEATIDEETTITAYGPPYYCVGSPSYPGPHADEIWCGFWSCSV